MKIIKKRFDNLCVSWNGNSIIDETFLKSRKMLYNDVLESNGYVFLRDIYESIGIPITKEACIFGWHKNGSERVLFDFLPIKDTNDYELIFKCYPILEYLDKEESEA